MKQISIIKALVAIAIVMTFVMPVAAVANVGTGVPYNTSKNESIPRYNRKCSHSRKGS